MLNVATIGRWRRRLLANVIFGSGWRALPAMGAVRWICSVFIVLVSASSISVAEDPTVIVAKRVLLEPAAEMPFPIHIKNRDELPKNSFLRIRGDLSGLNLSQGHRISASAWAIPIGKLAELTIKLEAQLASPRQLRVLLVALDGSSFRSFAITDVTLYGSAAQLAADKPPGKQRQTLALLQTPPNLPIGSERKDKSQTERILPPSGRRDSPKSASRAPITTPIPPTAPAPRAAMSPTDRAKAVALLKRGQAMLTNGDVNSARLFFGRAVRIGLGQAALAMAETYDPDELRRLGVLGIQPNLAEARKWYEKAQELGEGQAEARLSRLNASN